MDNEEAQELLAEAKALHAPMKTWLASHTALKSKFESDHGEFPMFARDLLSWGGWREARREYLRWVDAGKPSPETKEAGENKEEGGRKRRSRWNNEPTNGEAPKRKSRWDRSAAPPVAAPVVPVAAPITDPVLAALGLSSTAAVTGGSNIPPEKQAEYTELQARLRKANARLANTEAEAARIDALPRNHPDRSPSPPPVYNPDGSRKNTRAARWKEKYTEERSECLEKMMSLTNSALPSFIAKRKRSVKIPIPVEEHPTYNFIGLIIGPRGKTQKEMESKTGCKIAIRGKGSVKEGARGRLSKTAPQEGEDEPLHVVVTGDDPAQIEIAAEMVRSMLVVIDDEVNVHKQNQLRELALLNGTLKDNEEWCITCGEKGHRDFECPKRFSLGNKAANLVKCAICGETSHPTRDCKRLGEEIEKKEQLDEDYSAFMAELDGKPVEKKEGVASAAATAAPVPAVGGGSVLTILQPARVVKSDGTVGEPLPSTVSSTVPKAEELTGVTTISSTVPGRHAVPPSNFTGITTISSTVPGSSVSGIATISSTIPGAQETPAPAIGISTVPTETAQNGLPLPPPPPAAPGMSLPLPPPPSGMPPPAVPQPAANGFMPQNNGVPPPPPPPGGGAYAQYPQQGYYQQPAYPAQPYGQPPPQQQQQWGAQNSNVGGWNPNAYYDPTGGAGGFNWWDSSE